MGGYGSGGHNKRGRIEAETVAKLGADSVAKSGALDEGVDAEWRWRWNTGETSEIGTLGLGRNIGVRLKYRILSDHCDEPMKFDTPIHVQWTPCNFGGERVWWLCPVCGTRCLKLYFRDRRFACRKCQYICHRSQNEIARDRVQSHANKIRQKLGGQPGVEMFPPKPKGMHWRTYDALMDELSEADRAFFLEFNRLSSLG